MSETPHKLKHLEHLEDRFIDDGHNGLHHAIDALHSVHHALSGKDHPHTKITTKYDGSVSVVFGHHPKTNKFFVASKSAFNKNPKINYTHDDIEKNHGHAPGLVKKLKHSLTHLKKVAPSKGIYQGDYMYSSEDLHHGPHEILTTPNTITYGAKHDSVHGEKMKRAHMGIVVHTKYKGDDFDTMSAEPHTDVSNFTHHPDVHVIGTELHKSKFKYKPAHKENFEAHMKHVDHLTKTAPSNMHSVISKHAPHIKTYINKTIRDDTQPNIKDFHDHLFNIHKKNIDSVKTEKAKTVKQDAMVHDMMHFNNHREHYDHAFKLHHHIQQAKNALTHALSDNPELSHYIDGKETKPEGFVIHHKNQPVKFVDRHEFSRANFLKDRSAWNKKED